MKYASLVLLSLVGGCATGGASAPSSQAEAPHYYAPTAAAALAFDPPIAADQPMLDLSRAGRNPSAFAGYEQSVTSYYYLHQRDQIRTNRNGTFDRTAYTDVTSITSR